MIEFQFESLGAFFAMAPHGPFVWSTYGVGLLVLGALYGAMRGIHRRAIGRIGRQLKREGSHESEA